MENNQEKKQFSLGNKMVNLIFTDFEGDIDVDDFLKIDYGNLIAELLTYPVIVNRFGILLADIESEVKKGEFNVSIAKSDFEEEKAKIEQVVFKILKETINSPTAPQINGAVIQREDYKAALKTFNDKKLSQIELEGNKAKINSLYWIWSNYQD